MAHKVVFRPAAAADLKAIYDYISLHAGRTIAKNYIDRIETECKALQTFPQRGSIRDDLSPGIRVVGFERRASIAFSVEGDMVRILRIFYGGQNFPEEWLDR